MAPTKAKFGKQKGASDLTTIFTRTKRAGSKRLAITMNQSIDERASTHGCISGLLPKVGCIDEGGHRTLHSCDSL